MRGQRPALWYAFLAALDDPAAGGQPPAPPLPERTLLVCALTACNAMRLQGNVMAEIDHATFQTHAHFLFSGLVRGWRLLLPLICMSTTRTRC